MRDDAMMELVGPRERTSLYYVSLARRSPGSLRKQFDTHQLRNKRSSPSISPPEKLNVRDVPVRVNHV